MASIKDKDNYIRTSVEPNVIDGNYYVETSLGHENIYIKNGCCKSAYEKLVELYDFDYVRIKDTPHGHFLVIYLYDCNYGAPQFKLFESAKQL